jgi:hypothetical protein
MYISPDIIKAFKLKVRWAGYAARLKVTSVYKILFGKPDGKIYLWKEHLVRMDIKEMWCDGMDWARLRIESSIWLLGTQY